jgi:sugar-specific transcriptional regulator TrmB
MIASELARELNIPASNVYRLLKRLETIGFVTPTKTNLGPTYYFAERLEQAPVNYAHYQRDRLLPLLRAQASNQHYPSAYAD